MATALATLMALPMAPITGSRTPLDRLDRLERALGPRSPRLFIKRDDLLGFGCGGNKVRKMQLIAAEAAAKGTDTLITCGAIQSNHARVTAAVGAVLGWRVVLVLNGEPPAKDTGNLRLDRLFGAEIRFVADRADREPAMQEAANEARARGRVPFVVPMGASTATGVLGMARAVAEISASGVKPAVIVHASSSGATQAGLVAGCALIGNGARVVGVSADAPAAELAATVRRLIEAAAAKLGAKAATLGADRPIEIDEAQVGGGYGVPTPESSAARTLLARTEGIVLDSVYTAKAMAGLIAAVRDERHDPAETVVFWHTGGLHE
jgi:1-aminocyclopropane-1-carboxylate deaminase/D-cysteine desulfhydrase-like pyridoxal-dependent ACC family enzyme